MAEHNTGMSGGSMHGGIAIGKSSGSVTSTVGPTTNNTITGGSGITAMGNVSAGHDVNLDSGRKIQEQQKDPEKLTKEEIKKLLQERSCSDDTIKTFSENKVDGYLLMDLDDDLLKTLNVTDDIEIRRLKKLVKDLSKGHK